MSNLSYNDHIVFLDGQIEGFKATISRNYENQTLCAHIRERISELEKERQRLGDNIEVIHQAQIENIKQ